jgi:hypothetical protein
MKVQSHRLSVEQGVDFVFNVGGGHEDAAEITRRTAALAAPHANRRHSPECRYRKALGARLLQRGCAIGGSWPFHFVYLAVLRLPVGRSVYVTMRRGRHEGKHPATRSSEQKRHQTIPANPSTKSAIFLCLLRGFPLFFGALGTGLK